MHFIRLFLTGALLVVLMIFGIQTLGRQCGDSTENESLAPVAIVDEASTPDAAEPGDDTLDLSPESSDPEAPVEPEGPLVRVHTIAAGETFGGLMQAHGVTGVKQIVELSKPHIDLSKVRPGKMLEITFEEDRATQIRLEMDTDRSLFIQLTDPVEVRVEEATYERQPERVDLTIQHSLCGATSQQDGFGPALCLEMEKVFENQVDFNTDIRSGARVVVVLDALSTEGEFVRYEELQAMWLENAGKTYTAVRYTDSEGKAAWYDLDGEMLNPTLTERPQGPDSGFGPPFKFGDYLSHQRKSKSRPLKKGELRINSDFYRPRCGGKCRHSALDFKAAQGTPVIAIGSGTIRAITSPGSSCGNGVQIAMTDAKGVKWRALYCHLSKLDVKKKQKVKKGQKIGLSGGTPGTHGAGNTTGAHLHLELRKASKKGSMPLVDPIPYIDWEDFFLEVKYTPGHEPKNLPKKPVIIPPVTETADKDKFLARRDQLKSMLFPSEAQPEPEGVTPEPVAVPEEETAPAAP